MEGYSKKILQLHLSPFTTKSNYCFTARVKAEPIIEKFTLQNVVMMKLISYTWLLDSGYAFFSMQVPSFFGLAK